MKPIIPFLSVIFLLGCDGKPQKSWKDHKFSIGSSEFLSPKDLGIEKYEFKCSPRSDEVAIFRSRSRSRLKPQQGRAYDQIFWTNGGEAVVNLVIAPLSFYVGYPKPSEEAPAEEFRDSWRIRAGAYGYDVDNYTFEGSNTSGSGERSTARIVYTKNVGEKTEELVFEFEMFIMSLTEAKKLHPKMNTEREAGTKSWMDAYMVEEMPKGG